MLKQGRAKIGIIRAQLYMETNSSISWVLKMRLKGQFVFFILFKDSSFKLSMGFMVLLVSDFVMKQMIKYSRESIFLIYLEAFWRNVSLLSYMYN